MEDTMYVMENPGASSRALVQEWAYYMENRDKSVRRYRDKYVVISGNKVVASYEDENKAYYDTIKTIPLGSFIIHHATDPEEVFCLSPVLF